MFFVFWTNGFLRDHKVNHKKSLVRAERRVNYLKGFFEGAHAAEITTPIIDQHIEMRMDIGTAKIGVEDFMNSGIRVYGYLAVADIHCQ